MLEFIGGIVVIVFIANWIQSIISKNRQKQLILLVEELHYFENELKSSYTKRKQLYNDITGAVIGREEENLSVAIYLLLYKMFDQKNYSRKLLDSERVVAIIYDSSINIEMLLKDDFF